MKKIVYLIMMVGLVLGTACNPMDDTYKEIGESENIISGDVAFEMSDDDYDELGLSYGTFNSVDDAKAMIPDLLTGKYPVWGAGSFANVTFKLYNPKKTEKSLIVDKVLDSDYQELGFTYGNFSSFDQIVEFLDWKYPNPTDRVLVALTYKYYSGGVSTVKNGFIYVKGEWNMLQGFTQEEYNAMGEKYDNFTSKTVAEDRIPIYLKDYFKYDIKEAGDIASIMYNIYQKDYDDIDGDGNTSEKTAYSYAFYCIYDGTSWVEYENEVNDSVKFGHDGVVWVPDNTIKYAFTTADYDSLGEEYGEPGYYDNYDVREGKENYASPEVILADINTVLIKNFPGMEEGQKFSVDYNVYSGTAEIWTMNVVLTNGEYILQ